MSRNERESRRVARTYDTEMSTIYRRNLVDAQPLRCRDYRGVDRAEREVSVLRHELSDPKPISSRDRLDNERTLRQIGEESDFRFDT